METKIPVLFDTDIGSDIDDAVALAYLLAQPRCELVGITTVFGDVLLRASLADAVCRAAGRRDIPIFAGVGVPLTLDRKDGGCSQAEVLADFEHRPSEEFESGAAVPFMREIIHSRPGEITLLAVGPMTNVGLLYAIDREIPKLLKQVVLMCGDFAGQTVPGRYAEWNAQCDPPAADLVYRMRGVSHLSIGLNVTMKCRMPADEVIARFRRAGGALNVVASAATVWARHTGQITFHDPLAATVIFEPDLIRTEPCLVQVETAGSLVAGLTHWTPRAPELPHTVAMVVDPVRFFEHYFGTVGAS